MKGDFTRLNFNPSKHYNNVWMQQGRLQLDADWNEFAAIQNYLRQSITRDIISEGGVANPGWINQKGFEIIPDGGSFKITPGHIYVNGNLCELERVQNYTEQPDYPNPSQPQGDGIYLAYLDVWERHVTAIETPEIREVALDAKVLDTTTRTKIVWQVKLELIPDISLNDIKNLNNLESDILIRAESKKIINKQWQKFQSDTQRKSLMTADFQREGTAANTGQLENQLYRVEIHKSGSVVTATFKWSRDNGIVVSKIRSIQDNIITIDNPGRDLSQSFSPNQWVEIIDEKRELNGLPGTLVRLTQLASRTKLVFAKETVGDPITLDNFDINSLKVRRWDNALNTAEISTSTNWINLEAGIQVKFDENSVYRTGDYWLIPLRPGKKYVVEWSRNNKEESQAQQAQGIKHHYCPLALLNYQNNKFSKIGDCRENFPSLVNCLDKTGDIITGDLEIQANLYVTGNGRVGIGTKTPLSKLHVANPVLFGTGKIASEGTKVIGTNTKFKQELRVGDKITANGQTKIITAIADDGSSLTINTSFEPNLPEKGISFSYQPAIVVYFADSKKQPQLVLNEDGNLGIGTAQPQSKLEIKATTNNTTASALNIKNALDASLLFVGNDGNVGIGINNPQTKLHIDGTILIANGSQYLEIVPSNSAEKNWLRFKTSAGIVGYDFDKGISVKSGAIASYRNINLSLLTGGKTRMTLLSTNGNVGIGTLQPLSTLEVKATTNDANASTLHLKDANDNSLLYVRNNGNIGIGTPSPDRNSKLDIQGNIRIKGTIFQECDRGLNPEVNPISNEEASEILKELNPVKLTFNSGLNQETDLGFLASEIQELFASGDRTSIKPLSIVALLTQVIKDQQITIARLEGSLSEQQQRITALERTSNEQQQRITTLERTSNEQQQKITTLERTSSEQQQEITTLERTSNEQQQKITTLERTSNEQQRRITALEKFSEQQHQRIQELQNKVRILEQTLL